MLDPLDLYIRSRMPKVISALSCTQATEDTPVFMKNYIRLYQSKTLYYYYYTCQNEILWKYLNKRIRQIQIVLNKQPVQVSYGVQWELEFAGIPVYAIML